MCGIVGYTGLESAKEILLDGLRRLEYRGYDSAGLTLSSGNSLRTVKALGKVSNLEAACNQETQLEGTTGIAHTRWATHGAPAVRNAHPHLDEKGRFAVVHNGIIDNYAELRRRLEADGHTFVSDTDTEVIPHLLEEFYEGDLLKAVVQVLRLLHGTYGIAVVCADHPGLIVTARLGSPIVIGKGEDCNLVASDVTPLAAYTRNVIYLNDGEIAAITPTDIRLQNIDNIVIEPSVKEIDWSVDASGKGNYEHFMLKEIYEQPDVIASAMRGRLDLTMGSAKLSGLNMSPRDLAQISRIVIAACGTSRHAGMVGEYFFEDISGIPTEVEQAAEFRYRNPIIEPNTLVIPISQSGETADTLAALRMAKERGVRTMAVVNVVGSSIAREADKVFYTLAGPEISVATTKAYSAQLAAMYCLAVQFGMARGTIDAEKYSYYLAELETIPGKIEKVLEDKERIQWFAAKYSNAHDVFFIGRGIDYAVCLEGSLKLKEISYVHSEAYAAGELKHGTISLIEPGTLVIGVLTQSGLYEKTVSNMVECKSRGAYLMGLTTYGKYETEDHADFTVYVPRVDEHFVGSLAVVPLQLMGYYVSVAKGLDVDKPRNLAKSVTVE